MAKRRNIEHHYRAVRSIENGRKAFALISFPHGKDGDYNINHVTCVDKCVSETMRYYGTFTDKEIEHINKMNVGDTISYDVLEDNAMIVRIA